MSPARRGIELDSLDTEPRTWMVIAAAAAGLAMTLVTVEVTLAGVDSGASGLAAAGRAVMVAVPVAVGCYAWQRTSHRRFGVLLIVAGFGWFLSTLSESDNSLLYSTGRVAGWFVELELMYLALSFPTGRLPERVDRRIIAGVAILVVVLYLPTALMVREYPLPAPYTSCESGCPENAFFVLSSEPEFVDSVVRPVRDALTVLFFLAVTARLAQRVARSTWLMRKTLSPVLVVAVLRFFTLGVILAARRADTQAEVVVAGGWAVSLGLPAMAAGFFVGLLRWRLFVAGALQSLGLRIHAGRDAETLRADLAETLGDPTLQLLHRTPGGWADADGKRVQPPEPGSGQLVTKVAEGDREIAAIVHDEALRDQGEFVRAVAGYARVALDNRRLYADVKASLEEVRESRARIVASADAERRRIERDLHDGAQQRLVALRIKLELAEEALRDNPDAGAERLHALGSEVEATLDEIRALAHGVYPPLLADRGLAEAVRAAALHAPLATTVTSDGIGRYAPEVESAVYFCCLEALQNAGKHADGATRVSIALSDGDMLRFEVRDDGGGFAPGSGRGAGLTNMRDRLTALGGRLDVSSADGAVVAGSIPKPS